jgi:hypothetical protein
MTSFEFGITAPPGEPSIDWHDLFPPPAGDPEPPDPAPCGKDCCAPAPEKGGLL